MDSKTIQIVTFIINIIKNINAKMMYLFIFSIIHSIKSMSTNEQFCLFFIFSIKSFLKSTH